MANHIWRRDVLKAGIGVTTAAVGATIMGEPNKIFAAPPTQRDGVSAASVERSISMYFDGYPGKGRCAAGGAHEAISARSSTKNRAGCSLGIGEYVLVCLSGLIIAQHHTIKRNDALVFIFI